ncbi:hypothetical protein PVAP13_8KG014000 [Panicum virgatum]|uniref:Uncharacterized protein n=1 Tax=Panicum virgatum TaxID=38727 RepID=A0A8T0PDZ4_PANVG|nr:hypothetical protein PVAP13_8KG014000 [Panicum virgatum]
MQAQTARIVRERLLLLSGDAEGENPNPTGRPESPARRGDAIRILSIVIMPSMACLILRAAARVSSSAAWATYHLAAVTRVAAAAEEEAEARSGSGGARGGLRSARCCSGGHPD